MELRLGLIRFLAGVAALATLAAASAGCSPTARDVGTGASATGGATTASASHGASGTTTATGAGGSKTTSTTGSGASSSSSSSSSGGTKCTADSDCASLGTACMPATCAKTICETNPAARGATCLGDGGKFCDGNGACIACFTSADCPPTGTMCVTATCTAAGACGTQNTADGSTCSDSGGKVCHSGSCVPCITTADCGTGNVCQSHVCVGQCSDNMLDGAETDVDCGGGSCPPCDVGGKCGTTNDCVSVAACEGGLCTQCGSDYGQACGSCNGVYQCDGTCSIATPSNYGVSCGKCGGTITCAGTCSVTTPTNLGATCTGLKCPCGTFATGTIGCGGHCVIDNPCSCCGKLPC